MFTILSVGQLVNHRLTWQEVGPSAHLISLMKELKPDCVQADGSLQLFNVVVCQKHATGAHLTQQNLGLDPIFGDNGQSTLLEELLNVISTARLPTHYIVEVRSDFGLHLESSVPSLIRDPLEIELVQVLLE